MVRKTQYATEEAIFSADFESRSKLNFGGNLYLKISKKGYKYFQFRYSLNGKSSMLQIGKFPDMSLSQAKENAAVWQAKVLKARQENREAAIDVKLAQSRKMGEVTRVGKYNDINLVEKNDIGHFEKTSGSSFKYLEDGRRFVQRLFSVSIRKEVRWAIWFQMLIPWRAGVIPSSENSDINFSSNTWIFYKNKKKIGLPAILAIEYVSPSVRESFGNYWGVNIDSGFQLVNDLGYLFPSLIDSSGGREGRELKMAMEQIWPDYLVDAKAFRDFFVVWAKKYSFFSDELISSIISGDDARCASYNSEHYVRQRQALLDWWGYELMKMKIFFVTPYSSNGKTY